MDNIKEQRRAITDEDLEKVVGGAGGTETYNRETFCGKLKRISEEVPGTHSKRSKFVKLLQEASDAAVFNKDFETTKAKLIEVMDLAVQCNLSKAKYYAYFALQYLADCGKIVLP